MRQHGFTLGRYTVTAARRVLDIAQAETKKPLKTRNLVALVTLDVRNAFTSAPWSGVVQEMERRKLPRYLVDISRSYLCDRLFLTDGQGKIEVTAGVPQGSVLRPLLWNIHYDRVLKVPLPRCADARMRTLRRWWSPQERMTHWSGRLTRLSKASIVE
jgi:hypothetical protein